MRRLAKMLVVRVALTLIVLVGGCRDSDETPARTSATQTKTVGKDTRSAPSLPRPIEPRCGVEGLATPSISRAGPGWRLVYTYPTNAPRPPRPGEPSVISLDERHHKSRPVTYEDQKVVRVEGAKVDLVAKKGSIVAQWVTDEARYVVIMDGSRRRLERLVACTF